MNSFIDVTALTMHLSTIISFYYDIDGNEAGGNLHIVLDDGNVGYDSIYFCNEQCIQSNDTLGMLICDILTEFTEEQRLELFDRRWDRN